MGRYELYYLPFNYPTFFPFLETALIFMKIAIISDIHANLEALTAVMEDIQRQNITSIYVLGDIVGYGVDPMSCLSCLQQHEMICVQGNHDYMAAANKYPSTVSSMAKQSLEWTRKSLSTKSIKYLLHLPLIQKITDDIVITHASLYQPEKWHYIKEGHDDVILNHFASQMSPICCVGHTHIPNIIQKDNQTQAITHLPITDSSIKLNLEHQYIINPGSVGFSRDKDYRASYVTINISDNEAHIDFHRVDYEQSITLEKLQKRQAHPSIIKHFS